VGAVGALSLSEFADVVTIVGVFAALVSAAIAYRGWRHRTGHWLYIPAPNVLSQDPGAPDFWVFPPLAVDDDVYAVVIAGKLVNAGPSDAFSIHIYAEPEFAWKEGVEPVRAAAKVVTRHKSHSPRDEEAIMRSFLEVYKSREHFIPVLRVGDERRFVVVLKLKRSDPYLQELLDDRNDVVKNCELSGHWETQDRKQAHGVHATSRTILGGRIMFESDDLCAPFEVGRGPSARLRRWVKLRRGSRR
jgi:hypothetical protein